MTNFGQKPDDALGPLGDRLVDRYERRGLVQGQAIRDLVAAEASRYEGAKVRAFVPILVERAVRSRLDAMFSS